MAGSGSEHTRAQFRTTTTYPDEEAVLYAIMRVGSLRSENPLTALASPYHSQKQTVFDHRQLFTPRVEAVHVIPDASGKHAVFAMTLLGADVAAQAAAKEASGFVMGEWALSRRPRDGLLEIALVRRFVVPKAAGDTASSEDPVSFDTMHDAMNDAIHGTDAFAAAAAAAGDAGDVGDAALDVPTEELSVEHFLRLASSLNPTWLRAVYAQVALHAVRQEAEAALASVLTLAKNEALD